MKSIFISLPVADLARSVAFYRALGFESDARFGSDDTACLVWSETIRFMLLTEAKWRGMTTRPIPPPSSSEVMLALSCADRAAVDRMAAAAEAHGGQVDINPVEDHPFMYTRDLADPDGHAIGAMWFDMAAMPDSPGP